MANLKVTSRGQATFRKDVLQHLGIQPGDTIDVNKLPGGQVALKAAKRTGKISDIFGMLAGETDKVATLDEISQAIEDGWAGKFR